MTIPLTNSIEQVLVDDEDYPFLNEYRWQIGTNGLVRRSEWFIGKRWKLLIHRVILNAPPEFEVDHRDHNRLNNQKVNLRLASTTQNQQNKLKTSSPRLSRFKGVSRQEQRTSPKKWFASIRVEGRPIRLGYFLSQQEAAVAYNEAAVTFFGEFAYLNTV